MKNQQHGCMLLEN